MTDINDNEEVDEAGMLPSAQVDSFPYSIEQADALNVYSEEFKHQTINDAISAKLDEQVELSPEDIAIAIDSNNQDLLTAVANTYKKSKKEAFNAQRKRVSRRLLLAKQATQLVVNCPVTGVTSLMDMPAIPGLVAICEHPLSKLENCRGLAQQGILYLNKLSTQALAGILIVLADSYNLFRFQPADSGAQKNALLRTVGKESIINMIVLIEEQIHSGNASFLPKLSLIVDPFMMEKGISGRFNSYAVKLAEAIAKPDKEAYDENAKPKKIGRPVYIKDVEAAEKKLSYLARQELAAAKKELKEDSKRLRLLAQQLVAKGKAKAGMVPFMRSLTENDGLAYVDSDIVQKLCNDKLAIIEAPEAEEMILILRKNRSIFHKEIIEEADLLAFEAKEVSSNVGERSAAMASTNELNVEEHSAEEIANAIEEKDPTIGMSSIEKILWLKKKKNLEAKQVNFEQSNIPSVVTYIPTEEKRKLGE
jgi:hypothetical protein